MFKNTSEILEAEKNEDNGATIRTTDIFSVYCLK
jgi:hypothetical protein